MSKSVLKSAFLSAVLTLTPSLALAQEVCAAGSTCIPPEDMKQIVSVLEEKDCLQNTKPTFTLDPITMVTDQDGRLYYNGANPSPYTVKMGWCNYQATGTGKLNLIVAKQEPSVWGFRLRVKPLIGVLPVRLLGGSSAMDSTEVGALIEPFHWKGISANVFTGARGVGVGPAFALTNTVDIFAGYHMSYGGSSGVLLGVSISLW